MKASITRLVMGLLVSAAVMAPFACSRDVNAQSARFVHLSSGKSNSSLTADVWRDSKTGREWVTFSRADGGLVVVELTEATP